MGAVPAALRHRLTVVLCSAWLVAATCGMVVLDRYSARPGPAAQAPLRWPADSHVTRDSTRATLVLFAHPRCPCTRATLHELDRILARTPATLDAIVLMVIPSGLDRHWASTDLWMSARGLPRTRVLMDDAGREAARFGSRTSGQVLFYDASGRLRFSGGITAGRGHEGDNDGAEAIVSLASHHTDAIASAPVYGCALGAPSDARGLGGAKACAR